MSGHIGNYPTRCRHFLTRRVIRLDVVGRPEPRKARAGRALNNHGEGMTDEMMIPVREQRGIGSATGSPVPPVRTACRLPAEEVPAVPVAAAA